MSSVAAAASRKTVVAHVNNLAASAAYWVASQASRIVAVPSADVGSIGVFSIHTDYSRMLDQAGIKATIVRSTDAPYKAEGNPWEPLSDDARAYAQQRIDQSHADFVRAVAKGRGTTQANVRESYGKGRVVDARKAADLGMIDGVGDLGSVLEGLVGKRAAAKLKPRAALI